MMKRTMILCLVGMMGMMAYAQIDINGILYAVKMSINNGSFSFSATVTGCSGNFTGTINILDSIEYDGVILPVKSISAKAFMNRTNFTAVNFGNALTTVGDSAFYNCQTLRTVEMNNRLQKIGVDAFRNCDELTTVTIPDRVTEIGEGAFQNSNKLDKVTLGMLLTEIKENTFAFCPVRWMSVGAGLRKVSQNMFGTNKEGTLKHLEINSKMLVNQEYSAYFNLFSAFHLGYCNTDIVFGEGIDSIGDVVFSDNFKTVPRSDAAFVQHDNTVVTLTFPSTLKYIGRSAFSEIHIQKLTLPEGLVSVGGNAFSKCPKLTVVNIPSTMESFITTGLYDCKSLIMVFAESENKDAYSALYGTNCDVQSNYVITSRPATYKMLKPDEKKIGKLLYSGDMKDDEDTLKEDVNGDGTVNSLDVLKVYKYMQAH